MALKRYTCKLDGYSMESAFAMPDRFFQHIAEVHKVGPPAPGNIKEMRAWVQENVREEDLISWPQD